jgi:hypothetical protein
VLLVLVRGLWPPTLADPQQITQVIVIENLERYLAHLVFVDRWEVDGLVDVGSGTVVHCHPVLLSGFGSAYL